METETPARKGSRGFTLLETIISLTVLLVVMAIAFTFFSQFGGAMNTETNTLAAQQAARAALDEVSRHVRMVGYGTARVNEFNPATWQRGLIYGANFIAFNSDADVSIGALPPSQSVALPGGGSYTGEGLAATQYGAETYVYTLDANADNAVTAADRSAPVSSFNPAIDTANPLDFALFSRVYGFNGTDYGGTLEPLTASLFSNATTDAVYGDGTSPASLFVYWLTEDLNKDGALDDFECVNDAVATCPPSTERAPRLYIWGDTNFDGQLSESEKTALRTMEVGSTSWSKNRLVSGGAYKSTTLAAAVTAGGSTELRVNDGTKLGPGYQVRIGTGGGSELATVDQVSTTSTPHRITLTDSPTKPHASGDTITVQSSTLLSAVRSVGITFSAITSVADSAGGKAVAGRLGRAGTLGLDYRVTPYSRQVEVTNVSTAALVNDASGSIDTVCPIDVINQCNAAASATSVRYQGFAGGSGLTFKVVDTLGNPLAGKTVTLSNSTTSVGTLGATTGTTDADGLLTVPYALVGPLGTDTVTATATCLNSAGATYSDSATHQISVYQVAGSVTQDCLSTVSSRTPSPATNFTVTVTSSSGPVPSHGLALGLAFDSGYLPMSPDFSQLRGTLSITGGGSGDTGTTGQMTAINASTNGSGQIVGSVGLSSDGPATGARLNLVTQAPSGACSTGGSLDTKVDFFKLELASTVPTSGCTESAPCTIATDATPPQVRATLTLGGDPISPGTLQFTRTDVSPPSGATSRIAPVSGTVTTDTNGQGTLRVMNNAAPTISTFTPLKTRIDVGATAPAYCTTAGTIPSSSPRAQFDFTGRVGACVTDLIQAYVSKKSGKQICLHVKNANPIGGCPLKMKGIRLSLYNAANTALDGTILYAKVEGGAVTASATCSTTGGKTLFKDDCQSPKAKLNNGQSWAYENTLGSCDLPATSVNPGQYFTFSNVEFPANYPVGRRLNVEVSYECEGICDCDTTDAQNFDITTPP